MTIGSSCIFLVPDDTAKTGRRRPQMLESMMGCPLLGWMVANLMAAGADRFFVVCHPQYAELVRQALPPNANAVISTNQDASDQLHVFLSTAEEQEKTVLIVPGAAILTRGCSADRTDGAQPSCVMRVDRQALMDALDEKFHFYDFLQQNGTPLTSEDGAFSVDHIAAWQDAFHRQHLQELRQRGITIWDDASVFVTPTVRIGVGTELLPGTILCGDTAIGADCAIGPNATLQDTAVGDECRIGASQLSGCHVGSRAAIGSFCAMEDVTIGEDADVQSGTCLRACIIGSAPAQLPDVNKKGKPFFKRK